jgi:ribonucleoside-diphosphate reductase alpha chain
MAIAPTTSSSFILGQVSPSIEPLQSNYFTKDLAKGKFTYKNPYLKDLLAEKGMDTQEVWRQIMLSGGSVQDLDFLSQEEKDIFKTFGEISQMEVIQQAADRQRYIDQGQSLNVMIGDEVPLKDVNKLVIEAWKLGVKTLYYQRGANMAQQVGRDILNCAVCEG